MNKVFFIIAMVTLFSLSLFGEAKDFSMVNTQIGLDLPSIAKVNHNEDGQIVSLLGANIGLGISYKKYFSPLEASKFNPYWGVGTVAIIVPYVQVGADYVMDNGFYIGGGLFWISPEIHFGFMF